MSKVNSFLPRLGLKLNRVKYGKGLKLGGWPFIFRFPQASLEIGDDCAINSNFISNLIGLYQRTIIIARGRGRVKIGSHVGISGSTIYARELIEIGDYTVVGANCKIFDNDFHSLNPEERKKDIYDNLVTRPVKIGENVFIGCNSIILKGTEIGDNCVVGAGSVVHGRFGPDCTIAGNPARVIRSGGDHCTRAAQEKDGRERQAAAGKKTEGRLRQTGEETGKGEKTGSSDCFDHHKK